MAGQNVAGPAGQDANPIWDCGCSSALCQHTLHPTRQDQPPEPTPSLPAPNPGAAGLAQSCASILCPREPGERVSLPSALGVSLPSALGFAPQQATALNFHHPWLKGSLRRSNPINPAQTSLCLMGKSQLTQGWAGTGDCSISLGLRHHTVAKGLSFPICHSMKILLRHNKGLGVKTVPNLFGFYALKLITNLIQGGKKAGFERIQRSFQPWQSLWFLRNDGSTLRWFL